MIPFTEVVGKAANVAPYKIGATWVKVGIMMTVLVVVKLAVTERASIVLHA